MFEYPLIWVQHSSKNDSNWLSTANCVWDGPQWLNSKQCLKSDYYLEFEHLFKVTLKIPDASQVDVLDDLHLLKGYCEGMTATGNLASASTSSNPETKAGISTLEGSGVPYKVTSHKMPDGTTENYQAITCLELHVKQSFEVLEYYPLQA